METATASTCPDAEVLAAYVDQGLSAGERAQLERHLADCDSCRLIVARVVDTKHAVGATTVTGGGGRLLRLTRPQVAWGAGSLAAVAAVVMLMINVGHRSKLADLAAAVGEERTVEARLTGGFRYGPVRAPVRSGGSSAASDDWTVYAAASRIRGDAQNDPSAPNLHALGLAHLVLGEYDDAVRAIEDAVSEDPGPARYHSDLAAAYLARAKHLDRPDDLPRALGAAERALKTDDTLHEARFNRALALEALFLEDQARKAWEDYIARDPSSGWANEARERLQKLQQRVAPRDGARNNSPPPITDTTIEAALDWLMRQGLPAWADAVLAGDSQQAALHSSQISSYAQQIAERNGDPFAPTLSVVVRESNGLRDHAAAIRDFAKARALADSEDSAGFDRAIANACSKPPPVLAAACQLELGRSEVLARRDGSSAAFIRSLEESARGSAYLEGRLELLKGFRFMFHSNYAAAIERYEQAYERLSVAKYLNLAGNTAAQIADMFDLLGFPAEAWTWRARALEFSARVKDPRLTYFVHLSTAEHLARVRHHAATAAFMASFDGPSASPIPPFRRARLEISRSRMALAAGDLETARAAFRRAEQLVNASLDFRLSRMKVEVLTLRAELEGHEAQLGLARTTLEEALGTMGPERTPHRINALLYHASLSAQRREWHSSAERFLADALRLVSRGPDPVVQPVRREESLLAFETASRLIRSDPALQSVRGLHLIEQLREVFEGLPSTRVIWVPADFEKALNAVTADSALLVFAFSEGSLLRWFVNGGRVDFAERPITVAQVTTLVNRLTVQVNRNPAREDLWRETLSQLYSLLMGELGSIGAATNLLVLPDGPLHRISFGSLYDGASGQYLFERTAVRVAPSVAFALAGPPAPENRNASLRALIIGDPELQRAEGFSFPRLVGARREAIGIASLYRSPTVMVGREAVKPRVMNAIGSADVLHFAGHAVASPNSANPRLLLAGDPKNSGDAISAVDLAGQVKPNATVVLAACETGATTGDQAESLTSISAAFLRAGAGSVVGALWPVDDVSSAAFFPAVHRELLNGYPTAAAVALAQRACRKDQNCRKSAATWIGAVAYGHQ
jgi:CHAT domain-containing protein/tetratricopeptide (TPR) repeat protein